jgi:uncharacterized repeat protein (TIGR04076 family)
MPDITLVFPLDDHYSKGNYASRSGAFVQRSSCDGPWVQVGMRVSCDVRGRGGPMDLFPEVEIVVLDTGTCPVLQVGDRLMYRHPAIEAVRTCAQALSTLAPAAEDVARATMDGRPLEPLHLSCPVETCGAMFVLTALSMDEAPARTRARLAKRQTQSSPRSTAGGGGAKGRTSRRVRAKPKRRLLKWAVALALVLVLGGSGGFVGVGYFAPDLLPEVPTARLAQWHVPLPREWFAASSGEDDGADASEPSVEGSLSAAADAREDGAETVADASEPSVEGSPSAAAAAREDGAEPAAGASEPSVEGSPSAAADAREDDAEPEADASEPHVEGSPSAAADAGEDDAESEADAPQVETPEDETERLEPPKSQQDAAEPPAEPPNTADARAGP